MLTWTPSWADAPRVRSASELVRETTAWWEDWGARCSATFTLVALIGGGYLDEARAWRDWLLRAVAAQPDAMQIMYGAAGERRLPEQILDWLPGYEGSTPVRVGNAASEQFQLDVYGELFDAMHQARDAAVSCACARVMLGRREVIRPAG